MMRCKSSCIVDLVRLLALFLSQILTSGFWYAFGVFYLPLIDTFSSSSFITAWIGTLSYGTMCLIGPAAAWLIDRRGPRLTLFVGGLLSSIGTITTAFSPNIYVVFISYGFVAGVGYGLSYTACVVAVNLFFGKKRALAMGIVLAGCSIGAMVHPLICQSLIDRYGWRGTMLIYSGIILHTCPAALLLGSRPKIHTETIDIEDINSKANMQVEQKDENKNRCRNTIDKETNEMLLKDKNIVTKEGHCHIKTDSVLCSLNVLLLCISGFCFNYGLGILFIYLAPLTVHKGYDRHTAASVLSSVAVASIIGRILVGFISGLPGVDNLLLYMISYFIAGVCVISLPHLASIVPLIFVSVIYGLFSSVYGPVLSEITCQLFGLHNFAKVYGFLLVFLGIATTLSGPSAGWIIDTFGSYLVVFTLSGGSVILSGLSMLAIKCGTIRNKQNDKAVNV